MKEIINFRHDFSKTKLDISFVEKQMDFDSNENRPTTAPHQSPKEIGSSALPKKEGEKQHHPKVEEKISTTNKGESGEISTTPQKKGKSSTTPKGGEGGWERKGWRRREEAASPKKDGGSNQHHRNVAAQHVAAHAVAAQPVAAQPVAAQTCGGSNMWRLNMWQLNMSRHILWRLKHVAAQHVAAQHVAAHLVAAPTCVGFTCGSTPSLVQHWCALLALVVTEITSPTNCTRAGLCGCFLVGWLGSVGLGWSGVGWGGVGWSGCAGLTHMTALDTGLFDIPSKSHELWDSRKVVALSQAVPGRLLFTNARSYSDSFSHIVSLSRGCSPCCRRFLALTISSSIAFLPSPWSVHRCRDTTVSFFP